MYVFPGKSLTLYVEFKAGDRPVSPSLAAYTVIDKDGEVQGSTAIVVPSGAFATYFTIPAGTHSLVSGQKYRQMRAEVVYTAEGFTFDEHIPYFVVPDLFLGFDEKTIRLMLGVGEAELPDEEIDFYRAYIDLATGSIADDFYTAISSNDYDRANIARNLILYQTARDLLPTMQLRVLKSVESETSKMQRFGADFKNLASAIESKYQYYYGAINVSQTQSQPSLIVLSQPTDILTGQ